MLLNNSLRSSLLVIAGITLLTLSNAAAAETLRLNFGVYSSNKPSAMVRVFRPVLNELEDKMAQKLGRDVEIRMQIARDYDQGISHLTTGKVDFSRFGPASYIEAKKKNEGIEILAMENSKGDKVFYGVIATKDDSDLKSIEDIRGRSFAFGDEGSTIGRFLSQLYLEQAGIRSEDLSKFDYLGRHDLVGTAVGAGVYAAGALNESTYKKLIDAGEPLRTLAKFPNVTKPWIARSDLDSVVLQALKTSLFEVDSEKALKGLKIQGFLSGDDNDYAVIRQTMDFNSQFFEKSTHGKNNAAVKENLPAEQTLTTAQPAQSASKDAQAIAAASAVLSSQVMSGLTPASSAASVNEPEISAALPTQKTASSVLNAAAQTNADSAALALAKETATKNSFPQARVATAMVESHTLQKPAATSASSNGNQLTINIELPSQLINNQSAESSSQDITINLSFSPNDLTATQAQQ